MWHWYLCKNSHSNDLPYKFAVNVKEHQDKLPTIYRLHKLHKRPYKARFNALQNCLNCLTAFKSRAIRYYETVYERSMKNMFSSIKNAGEVLNKLKSRGFRATSLSTYDFLLFIPHYLIKGKLVDLIERAFKKFYKNEGTLYLACNDRKAFFTSTNHRGYTLWSCQNVCDALSYLLNNINIRFGNKLYLCSSEIFT